MGEFVTYDKAKWHTEGEFPAHLAKSCAYTHTAFFIGWIVMNNLASDDFKESFEVEINSLILKQFTPVQLYMALDGVFTSEELNNEGRHFTDFYFDFEKGSYLEDYEKDIAKGLPSLYHVDANWGNFDRTFVIISKRYSQYNKK
ncbi:MAG TPA: hypothetical protein VM935_08515 [Chitinophagaceae bacterium]|jgi:hypothetical protein|nr:hypothetical protein [Chitinophagaceae bacterium]